MGSINATHRNLGPSGPRACQAAVAEPKPEAPGDG